MDRVNRTEKAEGLILFMVGKSIPCFLVLLTLAWLSSCRPAPTRERATPSTMPTLDTAGTRPFFRFDDNLATASTVAVRRIQRAGGEPVIVRVGDLASWTAESALSSVNLEDGILVFKTVVGDSLTSASTLQIPTHQTESLVIRMRGTGASQVTLAWRGDSEAGFSHNSAVDIALGSGEELQSYEVRLGNLAGWSAPNRFIQQLRFILDGQATIVIESIRAVNRYDRFRASDAGLGHFEVARDSRTGLFMHAPGESRYRLPVFDGAKLVAGLATLDFAPTLTFSVSVRSAALETTFVRAQPTSTAWQEVSADFSAMGGQEVEVALKADCSEPGNILFISSPFLYQAYSNPRERPINVIWYIIDALRPDHLDIYGYARKTAPTLAQMAKEGARFQYCFSPATWTKPSIASMLTGVSPLVHRVGIGQETPSPNLLLFPQELRNMGYTTISVTVSPFGPRNGYLDAGFDRVAQGGIGPVSSPAQSLLNVPTGRPFFLLVHVLDTHTTSWPALPFMEFHNDRGQLGPTDLYDARVRMADGNMEGFTSVLQSLGLYDHTLLIVTADHGEGLEGDMGGSGHSGKPYLPRVLVPLIMRLPGVIPTDVVVKENVQVLDIVPTVFDILGVPPNHQFQGISLMGAMRGKGDAAMRTRSVYCVGQEPQWLGMAKSDWYLFNDDGAYGLFHPPDDPGQTRDLASQQRSLRDTMAGEMAQYIEAQQAKRGSLGIDGTATPLPVDPETSQQLKALGYLN